MVKSKVIHFSLFFSLLLLFSNSTFATDAFCYRDLRGNLICKDRLEQIPSPFQSKAFFKEIKAVETIAPFSNNSSSTQKLPPANNFETENYRRNLDNNLPSARLKEPEVEPNTINNSDLETEPKTFGKNTRSQTQENTSSKSSRVQIFVAEWCPHCKALEQFLKKQKVSYSRFDVETDEYGKEVYEREGGTIPITRIGKTTVVGFDERKFKSLLEAQEPY